MAKNCVKRIIKFVFPIGTIFNGKGLVIAEIRSDMACCSISYSFLKTIFVLIFYIRSFRSKKKHKTVI